MTSRRWSSRTITKHNEDYTLSPLYKKRASEREARREQIGREIEASLKKRYVMRPIKEA